MKKFAVLSGMLCAGILSANPMLAGSFTINNGQTVNTAQTLSSTGQTGTVNSGGTLNVGGGNAAITFSLSTNGGTVSVTNGGLIEQTGTGASGSQALVDAKGHTTITVINQASGTIQTADGDAINFNQGSNDVTVNNSGTITSLNASAGGNQAVDMNKITSGSNTINNFASGILQASEADAVRPGVNGVVNNSGTIKSTTATGSSSDGIDAQTNSGVSITNAASSTNGAGATNLIEGGRHGITGGNTTTGVYAITITNNLGGTIQGDNGSGINIDGINGSELATITNAGTITGTGHNINDGASHDGDGVDVDGLVNLTNSGTIKSVNAYTPSGIEFSEGVTVGGGSITNSGLIQGSVASGNTNAVGRGITLAGVDQDASENSIPIQSVYTSAAFPNPVIINSGTITGDSESGIAVLGTTNNGTTLTSTVTITNNAGGLIKGNNSGVSEDALITTGPDVGQLNGQSKNQAAIELDDAGNSYVINNSGTITQVNTVGGTAVAMHGVSNALNVTGGSAAIVGDISGNTAANSTLTINPGGGNTFSYGYKISNFTVNVNSDGTNGTVKLSGANAYTGTTTVKGGALLASNLSGSATGSGAVTVYRGATIGGTGTIDASDSGSKFDIGSSANGTGTATVQVGNGSDTTSKLTLEASAASSIANANLTFNLNQGGTPSSNELVTGTTGITFGSNVQLTLTLQGTPTTSGKVYVLIDGTGTGSGENGSTFSGITTALNSRGFLQIESGLTLNYGTGGGFTQNSFLFLDPANDNIDLEVVPEPSTWALLLGSLAGLAFLRQTRRNSRNG